MKPSVSASQKSAIQQQLHQLPYVESCIFRSQAYDFSEAKHLLSPDEAQALTVGTTPSSERCVLNNPSQAQAIAKQFDGYPGVRDVESPNQAIRNMESVTKILQLVFLILAVILLLSASVLILNTIRLAIFARRREVSVMKLVGPPIGSSAYPSCSKVWSKAFSARWWPPRGGRTPSGSRRSR